MFRIIRKGTLLAALATATCGGVYALAGPVSNNGKVSPDSYKPEQVIVLKEQGKPYRKCLITSTTKQKDGSLCYKVKALDNGEILTIFDRHPNDPLAVGPPSVVKNPPAGPDGTISILPPDSTTKFDQPPAPSMPTNLTANAAVASQTPPPKPPSKGLWTRIFGPSATCSKSSSSCTACQNGNPVPLIKPQPTGSAGGKPTTAAVTPYSPSTAPSNRRLPRRLPRFHRGGRT